MNLYSRGGAILYLKQHGRRPTEEAIAEYLDWCDSFTDTLMSSYPMPDIPFEPCYERKEATANV